MSRSKLFNMIKTRGTQTNARNDFDLTNRHAYSQKAGTITPIKALHVIPDDFFHLNIGDFTQTLPMMSAPFLSATKELAAYFVPYNTVWHNYNQYQATREDAQSVVLKERGFIREPRFSLYQLYGAPYFAFLGFLYVEKIIPALMRYHNEPLTDTNIAAVKNEVLSSSLSHGFNDLAGEGYYDLDFIQYSSSITSTWIARLAQDFVQFQSGSQWVTQRFLDPTYWYMDSDLENEHASSFGYFNRKPTAYTRRDIYQDVVGNYCWCDILRKYDMLGYGNLYPFFKTCLDAIDALLAEYDTADASSWIDADNVSNGYADKIRTEIRRLWFNIGVTAAGDDVQSHGGAFLSAKEELVSVYPLYAYNKIFYDYFRNTYYDDGYDVRNYNCDNINTSTLYGSVIMPYQLTPRFYMLETHMYKKDMFTGLMPSTQFGAVSVLPLDVNSVLSSDGQGFVDSDYNSSYNNLSSLSSGSVSFEQGNLVASNGISVHNHAVLLENIQSSGISYLDPLALKRVEALQQFRQDLLRAGNRTEDIFKQIFGTIPKSQLSEKPYFIDAVSNDFQINPVISTADTGSEINGSLGDIASRALSSGRNLDAKFSSNDFGCIIVLSYIIPETMYNSYKLDMHLGNLSPEEHFIPHFQNLGFEPLYRRWLNNTIAPADKNNVMGFSLPYLEFKTDVDVAHGAFVEFSRTRKLRDVLNIAVPPINYRGSFSQWVVARSDMQSQDVTLLRQFYINPSVLDSVFVQESGVDYESDQFICYTSINCPAVRQISELGLPNFL